MCLLPKWITDFVFSMLLGDCFPLEELYFILNPLVHWEDPEGLGGEGGGREDQDGEYMYIHG